MKKKAKRKKAKGVKRVNKKSIGDWKVYILETDKHQLYTGIDRKSTRLNSSHRT